jgi:hypothetical protein
MIVGALNSPYKGNAAFDYDTIRFIFVMIHAGALVVACHFHERSCC